MLPTLLKILVLLIVLLALGYGGYAILKFLNYQPQASIKSITPAQDKTSLESLQNRIQLGEPVSPNEPGYGRDDPFAPI